MDPNQLNNKIFPIIKALVQRINHKKIKKRKNRKKIRRVKRRNKRKKKDKNKERLRMKMNSLKHKLPKIRNHKKVVKNQKGNDSLCIKM